MRMKGFVKIGLLLILPLALSAVLPAQAKKPKRSAGKSSKPAQPAVKAAPLSTPAAVQDDPSHKRNERPAGTIDAEAVKDTKIAEPSPTYSYEFTRPGFGYSKIQIEHDETGKGKISFLKDGFDEMLTDPIALSSATLATISEAVTALNFLGSTEEYQHSRDYAHMGNTRFTMKKDGKERTVKFNWTDNKNAKALMDEYRKIGNEYTWRFEMSVGRENQPLQTPGLLDAIDSYIKRNEISDPPHLVPFLTELSTDERLPLIARNHALKLIKEIEKKKK